jgi:hypothetical protein
MDRKTLKVSDTKAAKLSPAMIGAMLRAAKHGDGRVIGSGINTVVALIDRGMVSVGTENFLTAAAWAWLLADRAVSRPADEGRVTVNEALALAYPHNEQVDAVDQWMAAMTTQDRERREAGRLTIEQALTEAYPETDRTERRQHFADTHPRNAYPLALNAVTAVVREMPLGGGLRVPVVDGAPEAVLTREDLHALAYTGHTTAEAVAGVRAAVLAHIRHGERPVYLMFPSLGMRPALYLSDVLALLARWDNAQTAAESRCEGHYDDDYTLASGAGLGELTYCEGSCVAPAVGDAGTGHGAYEYRSGC